MTQQLERVFNGRYELQRHIARGGMAEVYLAHDHLLDRRVAVKVLFPELSTDRTFVERFRREAQAAANLNHPNIVNVYDWGEEEGTYFIVMEYVDGRVLSAIIREEAPLPAQRAAGIAGEVAAALTAAHTQGVVHRDIKPGNILIDSQGRIKVTDFGIARAVGSTEGLTQAGAVMGTATYLAPEQAQGGMLDARTDIYALGCVTYEMLTGKPPFEGETPMNIAYKQVNEQPVAPRRRNPQVPAPLDAIVMTCLAKQPGRRYNDAEAMRSDLVKFRKNLQVSVAPETALAAAGAPAPGTTAMPVSQAPVVTPSNLNTGAAHAAPYDEPEPFMRRTGTLVGVLIALVLVLAGLVFALSSQFGLIGGGDDTSGQVAIPTGLAGLTEADARARLEALGFTVTTEFEQGNTAPQGTVLRTNPEEGQLADSGSAVKLIVSGGEILIDIPDVVGSQFTDAQLVLTRAGFLVEKIDQTSDTVPAGQVTAQDPVTTEQAPKGSTVRLTVSSGPQAVTVPDVKNKDATTASNELGQAGFKVATQIEASATIPAGQVIRTDPSAGAQVAKGTTITLFVSSGPAKVTVPNVVGKSEDEARGALEALGFTVMVNETNAGSPADVGKVLFQSPSASSQVNPGTEVTITIGAAVPDPTI